MNLTVVISLILACTLLSVTVAKPTTPSTTSCTSTSASSSYPYSSYSSSSSSSYSTSSSSTTYSSSSGTTSGSSTSASLVVPCDNSQCIKNFINAVRGAVIGAVDNLIVVVESEHLPLPPPCPNNPNCGIDLPDGSDFFEDGCPC